MIWVFHPYVHPNKEKFKIFKNIYLKEFKWLQMIASDLKWFIKYSYNLHNSPNVHNSSNLHSSYNLQKIYNSYNLHNSYNIHNPYVKAYKLLFLLILSLLLLSLLLSFIYLFIDDKNFYIALDKANWSQTIMEKSYIYMKA